MSRTKITLPSLQEIPEIAETLQRRGYRAPRLSDFAIANGAFCQVTGMTKTAALLYTGKIWTRNLSNEDPRKVATYNFLYADGDYGDLGNKADDCRIAVMPRLQNPEAEGYDITNWQGEPVLTFKDKIVYYPFDNLGRARERELGKKVLHKQQALGVYHARVVDSEGIYGPVPSDVFRYQDQNYIYQDIARPLFGAGFMNLANCQSGQSHWYEGLPVRAMRCHDGSIQILDQLAPCRFETMEEFNDKFNSRGFTPGEELDTDLFEIGQYLNREIKQDLMHSTEFVDAKVVRKLKRPQTTFAKSNLRDAQTKEDDGQSLDLI